jgi:hypothetical protein
MEPEFNIPEVDQKTLDEGKRILDSISDGFEQQQAAEEQKQQQIVEDQQLQAQLEDPRTKEGGGGFKGFATEVGSAFKGGIQDTVSSATTFPERAVDMLSGEMQKEREEKGYYRPEWDPTKSYENPIVTRTWWGQLIRGTVHFGTLAAAIIPTAKATAARFGITATGLAANSLVRSAGIGAASDIISKESDGHNALAMLRDRFGWMDTPLTTKDTDHPLMMKLKNIVEGMGIGVVFDSAAMILGKGTKKVRSKIAERNASVEDNVNKKAISELRRNEEFRAAKNKGIADEWQGDNLSTDDPFIIWENQQRIRKEWGAEDGSSGNPFTPVQKERIAKEAGISEELVDEVLRKLLSNDRYQTIVRGTKNSRKRLVEVFGDAVAAHQRITQGRNAAELPAQEYLKEIFESWDVYDKGTPDQIQTITSRNVVVTDLVVGSLLQQVRDMGISGREIADFADLTDIDGPAENIVNTMLVALTEVKRARIVKSKNFAELGAGKRRYLKETLSKDMADTRESIQSILNIAKDSDDDNLLMALFEAFSSMKTVNSLDDFDNWARKMIRGGDIEGKKQTGSLIRELEGMMVHSILSGPKTPVRAIMGTSTATFLRPMSMALGAAIRYPFNGNSTQIKVGLASLNAMMQAIPESFELFKNKLNSYWTGDLATVKTRFAEYTRADDNWEILRRWAEDSGRATDGDKALFRMANMARKMNDNSFFSYSTKIMAATDDAFRYILGRTKMREKSLRSALDAKAKGTLTTDITPQLLKDFEDDFYRQIFDGNGDLIDEATKFAAKEVTLTNELTGFAGGLNQVFQAHPWAKPFFLFARTGVNGLQLTAKHTPGFNFLVKEFNDIAFASPNKLDDVAKYGITSAEELANAKALQTGRFAIGSALTSMAIWSWMSGNLTGNGPVDRQKRQAWMAAGYTPRRLRVGDVEFNYDSIEPFNQIFSIIGDIGDASQLMGEEWTEDQLLKVSLVLAQGVTSKSYLAGMQQFVDLFGGRPGQAERIIANITNNQIPLSGLRNELGKLFTPYTRELNSGIVDAWRNRNLLSEKIALEPLPIKYDLFRGGPIKDHDPITRMWNAVSPINFNLTPDPAIDWYFRTGHNTRMAIYYAPDGTNLTDSAEIRSKFMKNIGDRKIINRIRRLMKNPKAIASVKQREIDIASGNRSLYEEKDYWHNKELDRIFDEEKRIAWNKLMDDEDVIKLRTEQTDKKRRRLEKTRQTSGYESLLNMYK